MPDRNEFANHMVHLLSGVLGDVQSRAMFGGYSLYHGGSVFAMTAGERLYFKVDKLNQEAFEEAGSAPFTYGSKDGKPMVMQYWEAPEGALDDPESIRSWAMLGVEASQRAAAKRKPKK